MEKSLAYRDSTDIGIKIKIKTETNRFAYVMRAMCQPLSYGHTDQIGRRAWNGFMEYIEKSVATFVNECNAKYKNGKDPKINPRATPDFLPDGIPEFISTTTHNNTYDISIGQITSSLTMEQVMSVYEKAKETEVRKRETVDLVPLPPQVQVPLPQDPLVTPLLLLLIFQNILKSRKIIVI